MDLIMIEINLRFLLGKKMVVNLGLSHDIFTARLSILKIRPIFIPAHLYNVTDNLCLVVWDISERHWMVSMCTPSKLKLLQ